MGLFHTSSARRREVRRNIARPSSGLRQWLERREIFWACLLGLTLATVASLTAISAQDRPRFAEGQVAPATVVARVDFRARDDTATLKAKTDASEREPAVYTPNAAYFQYVHDQFNYLARLATDASITNVNQIRPPLDMPQEGLLQLRDYFAPNGQPRPQWMVMTEEFIDDLATLAILSPERAKAELDERQRAPKIVIQHPSGKEIEVYRNEIFSLGGDATLLRDKIYDKAKDKFGRLLPRTIVALMMQNPNPTYDLNPEQTRQRKLARYRNEPVIEKTYRVDDTIVPAGHRLALTDLDILERERQAYATHLAQVSPVRPYLATLGLAGLITLISISFWAYILAYNPRIAENPLRGAAFTGLLLLAQAVAVWASIAYPRLIYLTATLPTLMAGIVLAIAYDRRFAMAVGALHTLLIMLTLNLTPEYGFVMLVGLAVAVSQLDEVRTRSKLLLTGMWAGLGMAVAVIVAGLATRPLLVTDQLRQIFLDARTALGTGLATGLIVQGVLPAIEKLFKVTTAMTLTELNDGTLPLLRRLAQEAPGTYQHSLRIADMAETAAQAIGAEGLLCKVGAMYHDIGKINKPQYFVENQAGGPNRHEKLSPAMSHLIIVGHVKDGIEMAREYRLPPAIRQFIETHHGTTLVEYFYHAAKQQREQDEPAPSEFEFRYPGPKPQTREAAILMLCDGIEGASRTLPDPTPARLEQLVHAMAQKRLSDGQFDECAITLQELHKIEQSITKTLIAIYHGRIAYPKEALPSASAAS